MKKNRWLWLLIIFIALLFAWRIYEQMKSSGSKDGFANRKGGPAVSVETGLIQKMSLDDISNFSGSLIARNQIIIAPKISGQLSRLHVNIGDRIRKGQIIAELDDRLFAQDVDKARAALQIARATAEQTSDALEISQRDLVNKQALLKNNYISQDEYNLANSLFISNKSKNTIAQATLNSSQTALNSAEIQLSYTKIKADWNGSEPYRVIGEKFVDEGSMLNAGTSIVSMLDITTLIAVIDVIESDYARIKVGQPASITTDTFPGKAFTGKIARIAPMLQETSRQARVEIEIANPDALLKPGMYARVQLIFQHKDNVTVIPVAALCTNQGKQGVFLVDKKNSKVSFVAIQTGIRGSSFIEVVAPPLMGEVVTLGQDQLDDGKSIILPGSGGDKQKKQRRQ